MVGSHDISIHDNSLFRNSYIVIYEKEMKRRKQYKMVVEKEVHVVKKSKSHHQFDVLPQYKSHIPFHSRYHKFSTLTCAL